MQIKRIFKYTLLVCLINIFSYGLAQAADNSTDQQNYSDQVIASEITRRIEQEPTLSGIKIQVTSLKRNVSVAGKVDTDEQASTVIEIAESVPGTENVNTDNLSILKSNQPITDTKITGTIKGIFIREKLFGTVPISAMTIHVETKNGIVYLTGTANNQTEIQKAIALAKNVEGVKAVNPKITIK